MRAPSGPIEQRQRGIAVVAGHRLVAEFLQHAFEQPALHRIVVDNEDGHWFPRQYAERPVCRFGALWPRGLKAVLTRLSRRAPGYFRIQSRFFARIARIKRPKAAMRGRKIQLYAAAALPGTLGTSKGSAALD